jgi:N-acetyl-gamma-glutamyl-phosphate reductase
MAYRAGIVGASGYTGAELLRLLAGHPDLDVVHVTAASNAGASVASLYPSLATAYPGREYDEFAPADLAGLDVVFLALPHGESQRLVPDLVDRVGHIVDLGADFRLPAASYERWYGTTHQAPELLDAFAYGLPEVFRADVALSAHVAAPGCYPTAATLALAPLLAAGLVEPTGIVVNAVSGLSGRGRGLSTPSLFAEADGTVTAYGLLDHRHTAEIELALTHAGGGASVEVLFTPHLVPMTRGILATCYARPSVDGLDTATLLERYREHYAEEPFVVVLDDPPSTKATFASNAAHVTVRFDPRTGTVLALGALDNLVKGASGQAVQGANLLLRLPETTGLSSVGILP